MAERTGVRYRYYVSRGLVTGSRKQSPAGRRIPAIEIEDLIEEQIRILLDDEGRLFEVLEPAVPNAHMRTDFAHVAAILSQRWDQLEASEKRIILQAVVGRVSLVDTGLRIEVRLAGLIQALASIDNGDDRDLSALKCESKATHWLEAEANLGRVGLGNRYVVDGKVMKSQNPPDRYLLRVIGQAHRYKAMVMRGDGRTISELASEAGVSRTYFAKILRLAFVSPDIVRRIMSGRQPRELTAPACRGDQATHGLGPASLRARTAVAAHSRIVILDGRPCGPPFFVPNRDNGA